MSEVRLIDANALKQDLRQYFTDGVLDGVSAKLAFNQILHDIDNAPTVYPICEDKACKYRNDRPHIIDNCDMNVFEPEKYMKGGAE